MYIKDDMLIAEYAKGNFGALEFMTQVVYSKDNGLKMLVMYKLEMCRNIRGTNLWILYSDLCDKDIEKVLLLCKNCPRDILEDACSRQDRSGVDLIKKYLDPNYKPTIEIKHPILIECPECFGRREIHTKVSECEFSVTCTIEVNKCLKCDGRGEIKNPNYKPT